MEHFCQFFWQKSTLQMCFAKPMKCTIGQLEVQYLSFHFSDGKKQPQIGKTAAVVALPDTQDHKRGLGNSWGWLASLNDTTYLVAFSASVETSPAPTTSLHPHATQVQRSPRARAIDGDGRLPFELGSQMQSGHLLSWMLVNVAA